MYVKVLRLSANTYVFRNRSGGTYNDVWDSSQPTFAEKWLLLNSFRFEKCVHCNNFAPFYEIDFFEVDGPNQF